MRTVWRRAWSYSRCFHGSIASGVVVDVVVVVVVAVVVGGCVWSWHLLNQRSWMRKKVGCFSFLEVSTILPK